MLETIPNAFTFVPPDVVELEPRLDDVYGLQAARLDDAAHGALELRVERESEEEKVERGEHLIDDG